MQCFLARHGVAKFSAISIIGLVKCSELQCGKCNGLSVAKDTAASIICQIQCGERHCCKCICQVQSGERHCCTVASLIPVGKIDKSVSVWRKTL